MKDPAFLFYPNDWLGGTMGMTFEEKGAYMELLMMQFNRGHMTSHMIGQSIGQLWDNIKDKFVQDDKGLYYNERLEMEKANRKNYTKSRRNNLKGTNQHSKKPNKKKGHMTSHMENENEIVNKDDIISVDNFYAVEENEIWFERIRLKHKISNNEEVMNLLKEFDTHLISIGEHHLKIKEYKKHFNNWLLKKSQNGRTETDRDTAIADFVKGK